MATIVPAALVTQLKAIFTACFTAPVVTAVAAVSGSKASLRAIAKDPGVDPVFAAYCLALADAVDAID
jgi:hypothetical protein